MRLYYSAKSLQYEVRYSVIYYNVSNSIGRIPLQIMLGKCFLSSSFLQTFTNFLGSIRQIILISRSNILFYLAFQNHLLLWNCGHNMRNCIRVHNCTKCTYIAFATKKRTSLFFPYVFQKDIISRCWSVFTSLKL